MNNPSKLAQYYGNDGEPLFPVSLQMNDPVKGGWAQVQSALDDSIRDLQDSNDGMDHSHMIAMLVGLQGFIASQLP